MSLNLQLLDSVSFSNKLSTNFACDLSSDGNIFSITDNGILIYTLTNYIDSIFTDTAFRKKIVRVPEFSLNGELGTAFENFYDQVSKEDLFERVLRLDSTSKLEHSTPVEVKPIAVAWSPKGLLGKSHSILGLLSNFHGLSILVKYLDDGGVEQYQCVLNVTEYIIRHNAKKWTNISNAGVDIQIMEWNKRVASTCPTAFVWSHIIKFLGETFAVLFVAHPNGTISSWKFTSRNELDVQPSELTFLGEFHTSLQNITAMYWNQTRKNGGALSYGNRDGKLAVMTVSVSSQENIDFKNEVVLWGENDMKKVNHITSIEHNQATFLIAVKEEFLLIFSISEDGFVLDEVLIDLGTLPITGLCHYKENVLLVLTVGKLKKLTLDMIDSIIHIKEEVVSIKLDNTKFKTCGIVLSENRVFVGILAYPCRLKDITRDPTPSNFLIYYDTSISLFQTIMNNSSGSLEKYWDCFEILRLISYKEKKFPWQGIDKNLDYDKLSLSHLKSLRWIAKLSEKVYSVIPSITEYNIKPYILLHYLVTVHLVVTRIKQLLGILDQGEQLTTFQIRSLDVQTMFLKEVVLLKILEKAGVGERFLDDMIDVIQRANELEYPDMPPCFWCGEKITGPTCIPPHADSRCSISMMQIFLVPGFKCSFCKCVAHPEIIKEFEVVTCPYCDVPMNRIYSPEKVNGILNDTDIQLRQNLDITLQPDVPEKVLSNCPDDGILEDIPLESVDDPEMNYLALTDSEDEDSPLEKKNYLRKKFFEAINKNSLSITTDENLTEFPVAELPNYVVSVRENENSDYSFDDDSENEEYKRSEQKSIRREFDL